MVVRFDLEKNELILEVSPLRRIEVVVGYVRTRSVLTRLVHKDHPRYSEFSERKILYEMIELTPSFDLTNALSDHGTLLQIFINRPVRKGSLSVAQDKKPPRNVYGYLGDMTADNQQICRNLGLTLLSEPVTAVIGSELEFALTIAGILPIAITEYQTVDEFKAMLPANIVALLEEVGYSFETVYKW